MSTWCYVCVNSSLFNTHLTTRTFGACDSRSNLWSFVCDPFETMELLELNIPFRCTHCGSPTHKAAKCAIQKVNKAEELIQEIRNNAKIPYGKKIKSEEDQLPRSNKGLFTNKGQTPMPPKVKTNHLKTKDAKRSTNHWPTVPKQSNTSFWNMCHMCIFI